MGATYHYQPTRAMPSMRQSILDVRRLLRRGNFVQAAASAENLAARASRLFGEDNAKTLTLREILAESLVGLGNYQEALDILTDVLACRTRLTSSTDGSVLFCAHLVAKCLIGLGREEEALAISRNNAWVTAANDPDGASTLFYQERLARCLMVCRQPQEALPVLERLVHRSRSSRNVTPLTLLFRLAELAACQTACRPEDMALETWREAQSLNRQLQQPDNELTARINSAIHELTRVA